VFLNFVCGSFVVISVVDGPWRSFVVVVIVVVVVDRLWRSFVLSVVVGTINVIVFSVAKVMMLFFILVHHFHFMILVFIQLILVFILVHLVDLVLVVKKLVYMLYGPIRSLVHDVGSGSKYRDNVSICEVGQFHVVNVVIIVGVENIVHRGGSRFVGAVVFVVVDRLVRAPFNDETTGLDKWLPLNMCQGFDARNGCIGDGQSSPLMTGDPGAGGQGQKIEVPLDVAGRCHGNGAKGASTGSVGGVRILKNLYVLPKLDPHGGIIGGRHPCDN
jgi:hypothetical protein